MAAVAIAAAAARTAQSAAVEGLRAQGDGVGGEPRGSEAQGAARRRPWQKAMWRGGGRQGLGARGPEPLESLIGDAALGEGSDMCAVHRLDDLKDLGVCDGHAELEFSYEEALELCSWMSPELLSRLAQRRRCAADESLPETEVPADDSSISSHSMESDRLDMSVDARLDAYEEAPPSELSSLVSRLVGLRSSTPTHSEGDPKAKLKETQGAEEAEEVEVLVAAPSVEVGGRRSKDVEEGVQEAEEEEKEERGSKLSSLVRQLVQLQAEAARLGGLEVDDSLDDKDASALSPSSPAMPGSEAAALISRMPSMGMGVLCRSSCDELRARYSLPAPPRR